MTWEQLVVPLLLAFALLVQFMRLLKGRVEEQEGEAAEAAGIPESMKRRVSIRESRGPGVQKLAALPAKKELPAVRRRRLRVVANVKDARRGIVLMTILGPCRASDATMFPNSPA